MTVDLASISVYLGGSTFVGSITGAYTYFMMTLPQNSAGTADLEAGTYTPVVEYGSRGAARISSNITVTVTLGVSTISPAAVPSSGGITVSIAGRGFPRNKDKAGFSVTYCGKSAEVLTSTTGLIEIVAPPCSTATTTANITYKNTSVVSTSITIDSAVAKPTVTSISPTTVSPLTTQ